MTTRRKCDGGALLFALLALTAVSPASAVIDSNYCNQYWQVDWSKGPLGPIFMCGGKPGNSTVEFTWSGAQPHGLFQIASDACPSDFTGFATETYRVLADPAPSGTFKWVLPEEPGDYWVTSQVGTDCKDGLLAQFRVMEPNVKPQGSTGMLRPAALAGAAAMMIAMLLAL